MPSIRSLISFAALCALTAAAPAAKPKACPNKPATTPTPVLPLTGGPTELPVPATGNVLKHVALGRGVQNYTCSDPAAPVAMGAIATLFDVTALAYASLNTLNSITQSAVYLTLPPNIANSKLKIPGTNDLAVIGKHYFSAGGMPIFDLYNANSEILFAKKLLAVPAPSTASKGPEGTGAVPWLKLDDKGGSIGVKEVYRVETAGGNAPALCTGKAAGTVVSVQYAAEYWFFG
jgi:hypothetical protein